MSLVSVVIVLIVIGILLYLVNAYLPMDAKIKNIMNIVVVVVVILWLLNLFLGGTNVLSSLRVGKP